MYIVYEYREAQTVKPYIVISVEIVDIEGLLRLQPANVLFRKELGDLSVSARNVKKHNKVTLSIMRYFASVFNIWRDGWCATCDLIFISKRTSCYTWHTILI